MRDPYFFMKQTETELDAKNNYLSYDGSLQKNSTIIQNVHNYGIINGIMQEIP